MTRTLLAALGAGSIAFAAAAHAPFGFGHRPRFFFAPEGVGSGAGGDGGADADHGDAPSLADIIGGAFDEASASDLGADEGADTNTGDADRAAAEQAAAVAADTKNRPETPAATADKAQPAPDQWTDADAAKLAALSPEVQNLVSKRIASVEAETRGKVAADVELAGGIRQIVEKNGLSETLRQSGMNEIQGVEYLANLERFARTEPEKYLQFVANHVRERFGIDPAKALGLTAGAAPAQGQQQGDDGFNDPRVAGLEQRLESFERQSAERTRQTALADADRQIAAVRDAKDADGKLVRPHFAEVEPDMTRLLSADRNLTLEAAYDAAVWSNPTVRAKVIAEQKAADERKARSEAANAAKAAKANVRSGQRPVSPNPNIKNSRDAVSAALEGVEI